MKSSLLFAVGFAVAWVALTPVTCRAQSEIAPDHFEMKNVEPVSQGTNTLAVNSEPAQMQIRDEERRNNNHNCASKTLGNDKSKGVHVQFDVFGFAIAIDSRKGGATNPSRPVQAIERIWKQARVKLNYLSFSREAMLPPV